MISPKFPEVGFFNWIICAGNGRTKDIRFVPLKPARNGLWFYELAIPLSYGAQYLLPTKLSFGEEGLPVATMVKYRCDIIISYPDNQTMLLFDRY
jgi:hypothetical protein